MENDIRENIANEERERNSSLCADRDLETVYYSSVGTCSSVQETQDAKASDLGRDTKAFDPMQECSQTAIQIDSLETGYSEVVDK